MKNTSFQIWLVYFEFCLIGSIYSAFTQNFRGLGWTELADYYTALRYRYGIIRNELTVEFYRSVGIEMMKAFYLMGNTYVADYYEMYYSL